MVFRDSGGRSRGHDPIAQAGGGVVESYPPDTKGKKTSASFLDAAPLRAGGPHHVRSKGLNHSVTRQTVPSTRATRTRTRAKR